MLMMPLGLGNSDNLMIVSVGLELEVALIGVYGVTNVLLSLLSLVASLSAMSLGTGSE